MNISELFNEKERPLESIPVNGGFCGILRKIACVGDSLSSGEFEAINEQGEKTYHDMFDYSWGQFMARMCGLTVYNFSRGGMTAHEYCESFAQSNDFWNKDKASNAYIIALGVNDISPQNPEAGAIDDIDFENYNNNKPTFAGYYGKIIQRYKEIQPDAKFFLMTMPKENCAEERREIHRKLIYDMADKFSNCYVLDLAEYGPVYDENFKKKFYMGGHMNPCGYMLTAQITVSYIDYIIRHNMEDFSQLGFMGTEHRYIEK